MLDSRPPVKSLGEVLRAARDVSNRWNPSRADEELWFRGADKPDNLLPSLYRPRERAAKYDEESLFEAFKALGAPSAPPTVSANPGSGSEATQHANFVVSVDSAYPTLTFTQQPSVVGGLVTGAGRPRCFLT